MITRYRCPTTPVYDRWGKPILGCGSWNTGLVENDGSIDCNSCGIWFTPSMEPGIETRQEAESFEERESLNKCDDCCSVVGCEVCGPCKLHDVTSIPELDRLSS